MDNALPRTSVGKNSVASTNFKGPRENAKNNRKSIMQESNMYPFISKANHSPVKAKAIPAKREP